VAWGRLAVGALQLTQFGREADPVCENSLVRAADGTLSFCQRDGKVDMFLMFGPGRELSSIAFVKRAVAD
jgi:hypothetical protein